MRASRHPKHVEYMGVFVTGVYSPKDKKIQERSAWWTMGFRVVPQNVQTYHDICGGFLSHGVPPNPKSSQIIQVIRLIWDHLWLIGGLEHLFLLVHILVMSKKTNWRSPSFFRGVGQQPTSHWWPFKYWNLWLGGPPKTPRQLSSEDEAMRAHEALNGKAIMGHLGSRPGTTALGVSQKHGGRSKPITINFSGMNIHLPAILMFTRGTRFWHTATWRYPKWMAGWLDNPSWKGMI